MSLFPPFLISPNQTCGDRIQALIRRCVAPWKERISTKEVLRELAITYALLMETTEVLPPDMVPTTPRTPALDDHTIKTAVLSPIFQPAVTHTSSAGERSPEGSSNSNPRPAPLFFTSSFPMPDEWTMHAVRSREITHSTVSINITHERALEVPGTAADSP